jgi:hypothetical protein
VALMTFEHHTQMTNRITRLGWLARMGRGPSDLDALPKALLERIYTRVYDVLTGKSGSELCAALPAAEGLAILEIVSDTKSNLPGWRRNPAEP